MRKATPTPKKQESPLHPVTLVVGAIILGLLLAYSIRLLMHADEWFLQFVKSMLLVFALILGLTEIRRRNSRLASLSRVANELGQGNYNARAEISGDDSFARVGQALNAMAGQISSTISELERSHEDLARSQEILAARNEELSKAYERQSRFGEFLSKLNTIDLDALANDSFPDLVNAAWAQLGALFLFDERTQQLRRITEYGVDRAALRNLLPEEGFDGLPGEAFSRRKPILVGEIDQDILPELNLGVGVARIRSVYAVPMLFHNKALGVIVLASINKPSDVTLEALGTYVRALAHAFNNALTYQAVQQQTVQFETANAKLLNLDHHRRTFVANMSHELRTPLNSIIGFSNILLKNRGDAMTPDNLDRVEKINRNGKNLLQLINDILDLSKIDAGRMETEFSPVELGPLIREVADILQPLASAKSIDIKLDLPEKPVIAETDAQKLSQILINLANNAVKFTDKGSVTVTLTSPESNRGPIIEVRDTGIGIGESKLESIFDAFRQADSTTSRKYGGTGLGLTISKTLLALLGGRINVTSKPGKGSCFIIELPVDPRVTRDITGANIDDILFDEPLTLET